MMRAVVQRVTRATVQVEGRVVGEIGQGLLVLVGISPADSSAEVRWLADKLVGLRIFADAEQVMNRSLIDVGGGVLVVSQFTLYGDVRKGKRPSFVAAAPAAVAEPLYELLLEALRGYGIAVASGEFGAMMAVELINDGPVTIVIDVPEIA